MTHRFTIYFLVFLFQGCSQSSDKASQDILDDFDEASFVTIDSLFVNFGLTKSHLMDDTLFFFPWDSLDGKFYGLILLENGKLRSDLPDIFKGSNMGITNSSSWKVKTSSKEMLLDVYDIGIDNVIHYKSVFTILLVNEDSLVLARVKTIESE